MLMVTDMWAWEAEKGYFVIRVDAPFTGQNRRKVVEWILIDSEEPEKGQQCLVFCPGSPPYVGVHYWQGDRFTGLFPFWEPVYWMEIAYPEVDDGET
jgi:hypothetical protein